MPDILIRGWDVPQGCDSCQLNKGGRGCPITGTQYEGDTWVMMDFDEHAERLPDCPLHELPEHGDLIDRDALFKQMGITDMDCYKCEFGIHGFCGQGGEFSAACEAIEDAPVVIPSNKEETE